LAIGGAAGMENRGGKLTEARVRLIGETILYSGWGQFKLLDVQMKDGSAGVRQIEDHGDAVAVLPYDAARRMALLVSQARVGPLYRGLDPQVLEAAAGIVEPGEEAAPALRREALEELGVRLGALEPVAMAWSSPSVSSERVQLYLAAYDAAERVGPGGGLASEHEDIAVVEIPLARLAAMADAGELTDLKTLALALTLMRRRPDLFA
jgi:nudix-type nucleoside diphosphatase (YffH/AdpP family)